MNIIKEDKILDDKSIIIEYQDHVIVVNGCCHSGLMNTIDYVNTICNKPISHIIGGFHMASASDKRIQKTIEYLEKLDKYNDMLYLFPIHCTGELFLQKVKEASFENIKAYNSSVGTIFHL